MDIALFLNSAGHFLTDAVCASALFGTVAASGADMGMALALYNTLAFSTQCVVGLLTDLLPRHQRLAAAALALCALALLLPLPWWGRVTLLGLGNSVFHVAGGTVTLKNAGGRAAPLGVFVAPGAMGLTLGTLYPHLGACFAILALALSAALWLLTGESALTRGGSRPIPWLAVGALLLAVAVRAVGGSAVSYPWKTGAGLTLLMTLAVCAGKTAGGFVCDRLGAGKTALLTVPAAAALIAFASAWLLPGLAGQLLLNLTMPVTLWLLYRAMPDAPGLSFGLVASALWPGTLLGQLISLAGAARWLLVLGCFGFGLWAMVYSSGKLKEVSR